MKLFLSIYQTLYFTPNMILQTIQSIPYYMSYSLLSLYEYFLFIQYEFKKQLENN